MTTTHLLTIALDDGADPDLAERLAEIVHALIPGSHTVDSMVVEAALTDLDWDDDGHPALPLGAAAAAKLMDEDGYVTVVTTVDAETFMGLPAPERDDFIHDLVFSFGLPHGSNSTLLAVQDSRFIVSYSTSVGEFIQPANPEAV